MLTVLDEPSFELDDLPLVDEFLTDTVLEESTAFQATVLPPAPFFDASIFELRPSSYCRRVDWRWHLAARLAQGALVPDSWVDQHVLEARDFQLLLLDASEADLEYMAEWMPGLFTAHLLHTRGPDPTRFEVEARILAKEPFDSIGKKCYLSVPAITAYEALFFNVLDRLEAKSYIIHQVIGPKLHEGLTPSDIGVLWKLYGYRGGSFVLDQLIYGQNDSQQPTCAAEVGRFIRADISTTLAQKAAIAVRTMRLDDPRTVRTLFRTYHQLQQLEQRRHTQFTQVDATLNFNVFTNEIDRILGPGWAAQLNPAKGFVGEGEARNLTADQATDRQKGA
ncbi:MAG TPA: hypothetical protein VHY91_05985 [Pirellulales bacterium]|jgi:hypothetical protein|nr:hypothetical protein [Pirellulales bacterium]